MNQRIIIIGAGIVGLAICRELLLKGYKKVTIIDKEKSIASHQSSRNSGVMHAGLYYKPGSLKATLSRQGIKYMKTYCKEKKINFEECGKIVIAKNKKEIPYLEDLLEKGKKNNLQGIQKISNKEINKREPYVEANSGILVPEESIVSYLEVSNKFLEDIMNLGGNLILNTKIVKLEENFNSKSLYSSNKERFDADIIISSSGLYSDKVSEILGFKTKNKKIIPFRGEYYCFKKEYRYFVNNLIYPVPDPNFPFLGVHFTKMINGDIEAGPNAVLALAREGYDWNKINLSELLESLNFSGLRNFVIKYPKTTLNEFLRSINKFLFIKSLKEYIPDLELKMFIKGNSGVRAQLMNEKGNLIQDFEISHNENYISILNAPSPAATSSIAIAKYVANYLHK
tara:strand:- start:11069 stop:12262 length:1194 start_codon:yes stop_codon:yes gene_type:complete